MKFSEIVKILSTKTVGIAGAGGLGSNCAVALARIGIGKLVIADFDVVTLSNLNRQYYYREHIGQKKVVALKDILCRINPEILLEIYDVQLDPHQIVNIYKSCDVIVEAFDLAVMKQMIIETVLTEFPGKPLVSGLGMAGYGNTESIRTKSINNLFLCGDGISEISEENPPIAPRVGIVANMQADTVLEILLKKIKRDENNTE